MSSPSANIDSADIFIPAAEGRAFQAKAGDYITLIDLEGQQIGDFVALKADDFSERLSTCYTRSNLRRLYVGEGDTLYTNRRQPILQIVEDKVGRHDITIAACDPLRYEQSFGITGHANCLDNLSGALEPFGLERWLVPEPFNIFQNSQIDADGNYNYAVPLTKPGDRIVMRALVDIVGAVSACAQDQTASNGYKLTPLRLLVTAERP